MVLKSYAKINLNLIVNKKLANGLHNLQSVYCLVNKFDLISIKKNKNSKKDKILIDGTHSENISRSNNSVSKILKLMRKYNLVSDYYSIKIIKKIPVYAGLAGGTSNAATILKFLLKKKLSKKKEIIFFNKSDLFENDEIKKKVEHFKEKIKAKYEIISVFSNKDIQKIKKLLTKYVSK